MRSAKCCMRRWVRTAWGKLFAADGQTHHRDYGGYDSPPTSQLSIPGVPIHMRYSTSQWTQFFSGETLRQLAVHAIARRWTPALLRHPERLGGRNEDHRRGADERFEPLGAVRHSRLLGRDVTHQD